MYLHDNSYDGPYVALRCTFAYYCLNYVTYKEDFRNKQHNVQIKDVFHCV